MNTIKILDIGAGPSLDFAHSVRFWTPKPITFISTDVMFMDMSWLGRRLYSIHKMRRAVEAIRFNDRGVFRVDGSYELFPAPDQTLDMVFLNCWYPFPGPRWNLLSGELSRTLKPGGVFFWSHPRDHLPIKLPSGFSELCSGSFEELEYGLFIGKLDLRKKVQGYPHSLPYRIPPSRTMKFAMHAHFYVCRYGPPYPRADYIYRDGYLPMPYGVWIKE